MTDWIEISEELPPIDVPVQVYSRPIYKRAPYKPASPQYKRGIEWRWQRLNSYGGWENCDPPEKWRIPVK